jgi:hypothetical protein
MGTGGEVVGKKFWNVAKMKIEIPSSKFQVPKDTAQPFGPLELGTWNLEL